MVNIKTYEDVEITVIRKTEKPDVIVRLACDITQKKLDYRGVFKPATANLVRYLYMANHGSILEHPSITVLIENVSRSFLLQITRTRPASYTVASQHYQDYRGYPDVISPRFTNERYLVNALDDASFRYTELVENYNIPAEEARQVLPNSKAVTILWTIKAWNLCLFLESRLCKRNTEEMLTFANNIHTIAKDWWPNLFNNVGPHCRKYGFCNQGYMQAKVCKGICTWNANFKKILPSSP